MTTTTGFNIFADYDEEIARFRQRPKRADVMRERHITEADLERYRALTRQDIDNVTQADLENMYALSYTPDGRCGEFPLGWAAERCEKCGQLYLPTYIEYLDEKNQRQSKKLRHPECFPHDGDDVRGHSTTSLSLEEIGIPNRLADRRFSNFTTDTPARQKAVQSCRAIISGKISGLLLLGTSNTGKTHLAVAIMAVLVDHGKTVTYRSELQIKSELKKAAGFSSKTSIDDVRARYIKTPNLIIDKINLDEGKEAVQDDAEKNFAEIIQERLDTYGTRTILLSNMTPERFNTRFGESIRTRLNRYGATVVLAERYKEAQEEEEKTLWS